MDDFRLKVFRSVANNLSFTKAAAETFITQPAITKHIKELESQYSTRLFERRGNNIVLTKAGEILLKYTNQILSLHQDAFFDISALQDIQKGSLCIGASSTVSQYLIAPLLAKFHDRFPEITLSLQNGNTEMIENLVLNHTCNLGIVEGRKQNPNLKYIELMDDELVAVVHAKSKLANKLKITSSDLHEIPFVFRERGSGTLEIIDNALLSVGIKYSDLKIVMMLGGTESIKSFLEYSNCMAFLPLRSIQKELSSGDFKIVEIDNLEIKRKFWLIHLQGQPQTIVESFSRFAFNSYNKK
jgi:LysR family transcriptional regulator, transcriptional activator of the cysJI operon